MKALITGGAGFIGHHLVRAMSQRGDEVIVLDDFSTGSRDRLAPYASRIRIVEGSVLDPGALHDASAGCEVVFHEAALASVERSLGDPVQSNRVNVEGTIQVVLAAQRNGIRRVVLAGSSSVYGVPRSLPCTESLSPSPASPYGVSKLAAEHYLHTLGSFHGIETVVLRYFNVFGPGQDPASQYAAVIPRFITAVLHGRQPVINGSEEISRDFTYVDNVVNANLLAATAEGARGLTLNVACGSRITLRQLLDAVCAGVGRKVEPIFGPARPGDIEHSMADVSRARDVLGYAATVDFAEGIKRTVRWFEADRAGA